MVSSSPDIDKNFIALKQDLIESGLIRSVTRTSAPITSIWWKTGAPDWEGKPDNVSIIFSAVTTDVDFAKTFGIKLLSGKDFSGTPIDSSMMLLNKAAVDAMGLKDPVGKELRYAQSKFTILGVTENVIMESPFKAVDPMMVFYEGARSSTVSIRLTQNVELKRALASIESIFNNHNPEFPFDYQFVDQEFGKKFLTENLINRITNIFAGLAIFLCCMGLAGLASFTIEKRTREIGIRKVLGASVRQLLALISTEFLKLVLIAFLIAVPLTWWLMHNWLENYIYHVDISIWLFAIVGFIVLLLALIVVSANTVKTAMNNPVTSLRTE
jgi:ABC-type antimicrobial peptide transport system permease subunit